MARLLPLVTFAVALSIPCSASAGDDPLSESLFQKGLKLMEAGQIDEACSALDRAVELSGGNAIGGLLVLAECREKQGRPASAWATYKRAYAFAHKEGDPREAKAAQAIARLEPALPRLVVHVAPALQSRPELRITRGPDALPHEAWELPVPVDPGTIKVVATATGVAPLEIDVAVGPEPKLHEVTIAPWGCLATNSCGPKSEPHPGAGSPALRPVGIAGVTIAVLGAIGTFAGIGVGVSAKSRYDDAVGDEANECVDGACNAAGKAAVDDARSQGNIGTGVTIAGLGLFAIGATLFIVDFATRPTARVRVGPRSVGWVVAF